MKKILVLAAAQTLVALAVLAQSATYTIRNVVDPPDHCAQLNTDMTAIDGRLDPLDGGAVGSGAMIISNATDGGAATLTFKADQADDASDIMKISVADAGTLSFNGTSGTNPVVTIDQSGNVAMDADLTVTGGDVTGANGNAIDIGEAADGTITFSRDDSGAVTLTSADDATPADIKLVAGGTGAITIGDSGDTSITFTSDGTGNAEFTFPADVIGDADIDWGTGSGQVSPADMTFAEGDITDSTIVSADIKDGTIVGADIRTNTVGKANLSAADFGFFTAGADGTCTMDAGVVNSNNLTAGDYGGMTVDSVGTVTIDGMTTANDALMTSLKTEYINSIVTTIATNANGGTNVVTFTCNDLAGTQMSGYHTFRFWIADSAYGAPAVVAGDVVISGTGAAEIVQEVDKAVYVVQASNGVAIATITDTPGGTNYIHTQCSGGKVNTPIPSAFNVP